VTLSLQESEQIKLQ